jgi:hypothetical protein
MPAVTPEPEDHPTPAVPSVSLLNITGAGVCWAGALALFFLTDIQTGVLKQVSFSMLLVVASVLTFAPIQRQMELPRLTVEGTMGVFLLGYTLAFVPPPTSGLWSLPDLPVYLLLMLAVFWTSAAFGLPLIYALRQRVIKQRARRLNVQAAQRQAYEVGLVFVGVVVLAGLRTLTWVSFALVTLTLLTAELLLLARKGLPNVSKDKA